MFQHKHMKKEKAESDRGAYNLQTLPEAELSYQRVTKIVMPFLV